MGVDDRRKSELPGTSMVDDCLSRPGHCGSCAWLQSVSRWPCRQTEHHGIMSEKNLLSVENLTIEFDQSDQRLRPVDGVSFELKTGEIVGLVGESGSGKSLTCRGIADLLPRSKKARISGTVTINGQQWDVIAPDRRSVTSDIAMVFQNPASF